jgi:hypothetical protein
MLTLMPPAPAARWRTIAFAGCLVFLSGCTDPADVSPTADPSLAEELARASLVPLMSGDHCTGPNSPPECEVTNGYCVCTLENVSVGGTSSPPPPPEWPAAPGWSWPGPGGGGGGGTPSQCPPAPTEDECTYTATLQCPIGVERGSTGTCTFSIQPGWVLEAVTSWGFQGAVTATALEANTMTWGGTLVESGQVRVEFQANGGMGVVVAELGVTPRNWSWDSSMRSFQAGVPGDLDNCMTSQIGLAADKFGCPPDPSIIINPGPGQGFGVAAGSGPGAGGRFVTNPTTRMDLRSQLAKRYRADGDKHEVNGVLQVVQACGPIWSPLPTPPQNDAGINLSCMQNQTFSDLVSFAWAHENEHVTLASEEAPKPINDIYALWESVIASTYGDALDAANVIQNAAVQRIRVAALANHSNPPDTTFFSIWRHTSGGVWQYQGVGVIH